MTTTILVTGATGTIGAEVLAALARREGVSVRAGVRPSPRAGSVKGDRVTPVDFDYDKPDLVKAALEGVDRAFLLAPGVPNQVEVSLRFLSLAKEAGVKHVVKLSALGCEVEPGIAFGRAHRAVEKALERSGLAWTSVRPNNFMENFLGVRHGVFAPNARGDILLPWGRAACSFVAGEDIAAVAAQALTGEGHAGKAYEVTGPEAITMAEVAEILSSVSGRAIRYVDVPEEAVRKGMLDAHMPPPVVDSVMELHALGKAGLAAPVTSTVRDVTGRPARSFRDFAAAHAATWRA